MSTCCIWQNITIDTTLYTCLCVCVVIAKQVRHCFNVSNFGHFLLFPSRHWFLTQSKLRWWRQASGFTWRRPVVTSGRATPRWTNTATKTSVSPWTPVWEMTTPSSPRYWSMWCRQLPCLQRHAIYPNLPALHARSFDSFQFTPATSA